MRHRRCLGQALLLLLWPGLLVAHSEQPLGLSTVSQINSPWKYDLDHPERPGFCLEILQAIERLDPNLTFKGLDRETSLRRVEMLLVENQIDVFCGLLKSTSREQRFRFIGPPIFPLQQRIAVRADDPVDVRSLDDIRRLDPDGVILVARGTKYNEWLRTLPGLRIDDSSGESAVNLRKLPAGRGRFCYHSDFTLRDAIAAEGLDAKVRLLPTVFLVEPLYFAVKS